MLFLPSVSNHQNYGTSAKWTIFRPVKRSLYSPDCLEEVFSETHIRWVHITRVGLVGSTLHTFIVTNPQPQDIAAADKYANRTSYVNPGSSEIPDNIT